MGDVKFVSDLPVSGADALEKGRRIVDYLNGVDGRRYNATLGRGPYDDRTERTADIPVNVGVPIADEDIQYIGNNIGVYPA